MPPPPNPNRRRRNVGPQYTELPSEGRKGDAPVWPLTTAPDRIELIAWAKLWTKPMAVVWERMHCEDVVARYVRLKLRAEERDAPVNLLAEVRQLEDDLGVSPAAARALLFMFVEDEEAGPRQAPRESVVRRLRAVDPGAVAGG